MSQFLVKKIIFDLDGTLIDSAPDLHAATNHVLQSVGRDPVSLQQVRHMVGYGALKLIELGLAATGDPDEYRPEDLRPAFLNYYLENITVHTELYEGAAEMLSRFSEMGLELGLCTNKPIHLAKPILKSLAIHKYFSAICGGDSFPFKKPDPRHIHETAALMPGEGSILMVGDSYPDIAAAKAAKVNSIAVSFGYSQTPAEDLGADKVIHRLLELIDLIKPA